MKPIKLSMTAFGPYAGKQVVDFRELQDRTFFLIHGPTGAGKTTILDAICFTLYGETSGAKRKGDQMRSHHTKSSLLTEVTFDFALGKDTYRVTRSPKQERPKERGEGTVTIQQKATLWKRNELEDDSLPGTVIDATPKGVTEKIIGLLGFESEQFRQVIVLPQDEFRQLLVSDSAQREVILNALFQTDLYNRIEFALKAEAESLEDEIKDHRKKRKFILEQAQVTSVAELEIRQQENQRLLGEVSVRRGALGENEKQARSRLRQAEEDEQKLQDKEAADSALHDLAKKQSGFTEKRKVLEAARKAVVLAGEENALLQQLEVANQAEQKQQAAQAKYENALRDQQNATDVLAQENLRESERESARHKRHELRVLYEKVKELDKAQSELIEASDQITAALRERDAAKDRVGTLQEAVDQQQAALQELEKSVSRLNELRILERNAEKAYQQRKLLEALQDKLQEAIRLQNSKKEQLGHIEFELAQAGETLRTIEEDWLRGQAAILAQQLSDNTPCPVCGSVHHPQPATSSHHLPSESTLKKSHEEVKRLQSTYEMAQIDGTKQNEVIIQLQTQIESIAESLGDKRDFSLQQLEIQLQDAQGARTKVEEEEKRIAGLKQEIEGSEAQLSLAEDDLASLESHLQDAINKQTSARTRVEERSLGIPDELKDLNTLVRAGKEASEKLSQLEQVYEQAKQALEHENQNVAASGASLKELSELATKAIQLATERAQKFRQRVEEAGFFGEAEYQMTKRPDREIDSLDEEIRDFEGKLQSARERVVRARAAAETLTRQDLQPLIIASQQARANADKALKEESELTGTLLQINKWLAELRKIANELEGKEERHAVIGRLADVATGTNSLNISFQRFVLAAKLDDVLTQTSYRLQTMSNGRYWLQRAQSPLDKRRAAGLDIEVIDTHTGDTKRHVDTFSGGEGFMASLALALGLADVVQAYSGGIRLDTIFIDEGFGSLDSEKLDLAIRTLESLREGGRLVGIISHVDSLKERVSTRLEVVATQQGSTARFIIG